MGPQYTADEIKAWIDACTNVDNLRQLYQTVTARLQDLDAAKEQAAQLRRPHVLVQK